MYTYQEEEEEDFIYHIVGGSWGSKAYLAVPVKVDAPWGPGVQGVVMGVELRLMAWRVPGAPPTKHILIEFEIR